MSVAWRPGTAGKHHRWDLLLAGGALLFAAVSLFYPFGRDQGLYYYVAREWVLRGSIPYRDVFDHKTPGIYLLHALAILLFGETMWGIRVFEVLLVPAAGFIVAGLAIPRAQRLPPGLWGASALAVSVMYFGLFNFWNTAQSEIWYATLGLCAVWSAYRLQRLKLAVLASGIFAGAAILMKPPAVCYVLVALVLLVQRWWQETREPGARTLRSFGERVAYFLMGALMPVLPVLLYFSVQDALVEMLDIVVGANAFYVQHEKGFHDSPLEAMVDTVRVFAPLSVLLPVGTLGCFGLALRRKESHLWECSALALALGGAGVLATAMQGKYYVLHWANLAVPCALMAVVMGRQVPALLRGKEAPPSWGWSAAMVGLWAVSYGATTLFEGQARRYVQTVALTLQYLRGRVSTAQFNAQFSLPSVGFDYDASYCVGMWLREHTSPEDAVTVRGFEPQIYAIAQRYHRGRFFWTTFLVNPARAYRREQWRAEDWESLHAHAPKYVVALTGAQGGTDSVPFFRNLGYAPVEVFDGLTILAKPFSPSALSTPLP